MTREEALRLLVEHPAQVARWCGYPLIRDEPHGAWIRAMMDGKEDMTLLAHRGSYKTTCLAMAVAILMVIRPVQTVLLLRKTDGDATEILRQVKKIIETDAMQHLTRAIYGTAVTIGRCTADEMTLSCYGAARGAAQLTGAGIGTALTGKHAERIFTDDIVTLRDRISPPERENTKRIYMELQNIRTPGGRIVNIGTPWHRDDAMALMPNHRRFDCYQTGMLDKEQIRKLRESMSPSLFAANYELKHIAGEEALFGEAPRFCAEEGMIRDGIAHVDASYGGTDGTALTCGRLRGGTIYLYGRLWHAHVDTVMAEIVQICERMMCAPVWCEVNADRGYVARELRTMHGQVRTYHEQMNKQLKISTFLRKWWKNIVFIEGTDAEYIAQILDYTETAAHDDAPDSAACVCRLLNNRREVQDADVYMAGLPAG